MIAYKAFNPGLICRGHQFQMGCNITDKANCGKNGFHCAENPLDCLTYYSDISQTEFFLVRALGDIDEDNHDTKISCTELFIEKQLSFDQLILHGLAYMYDRPLRECSSHVKKDCGKARNGFAVVRGIDPVAMGNLGDLLGYAKEDIAGNVIQVALSCVDGKTLIPGVWYGSDLTERQVSCFEQAAA